MSDAIKIAHQAPKLIEGLLADMFAAHAEDNRIALGGVYAGQQYIQIQLVATCNPAALLDDDSDQDEHAAGPALVTGRHQLTLHWLAARAEFIAAGSDTGGAQDIPGALLALGAVRSVYWLALGQGETALAREIGAWWAESSPLHGQGEVIQ